MNSRTTRTFRQMLKALPPHVKRQAREAYRQFIRDPYHPSLQFKRLHHSQPFYSARISLNYRAVALMEGDDLIWFWVGTHANYDQLLRRL